VVRQAVGYGDGFGDSEIEQSDLIAGADLDIRWLNVAVNDGALAALDIG